MKSEKKHLKEKLKKKQLILTQVNLAISRLGS
jgi:hypothetical protein